MPSNESTPTTASPRPPRDGRPSYELAFLAVPYALPATVGVVLLLWGSLELVPIVTSSYGDVVDLFETLAILTAGVASLFYGVAGALVVTVSSPGSNRRGDDPSQ